MRQSTRSIILYIVFFIVGVISVVYLSSSHGESFMGEHLVWSLIIVAILFCCAGYYYGTARGWHDIELRIMHPEHFKGETLDEL